MSLTQFIFYIFVIIGTINFLHIGAYLIGGDMYDIREFKRAAIRGKQGKKRREKTPFVSVIVPAHNEELSIVRCLDSLRSSTYKKIEVVVHNDHSTDTTAAILRSYIKKYPKFKLHVINRRKNVGKGAGVNYAIEKFAKGSLIMTLDADCVLQENAIMNSVRYFKDERTIGVAANVKIMDNQTILGLLQKFEHLLGYRSKKFYTMTNSEFIVGGVASTYRRDVMAEVDYYDTDTQTEDIGLSMKLISRGNRDKRIIYAADVLAMTEGVQNFKALIKQRYRWKLGMLQNLVKQKHLFGNMDKRYSKMLTLYRVPMAFLGEIILLMQPIVLGYIIYLSVYYRTTLLFFGAYSTITAYVLLTVWPDEHSSIKRKLSMSLYAPVMYFVFYLMDVVQIIAIIRVLANPRKIIRLNSSEGAWISPKRSGVAADFS